MFKFLAKRKEIEKATSTNLFNFVNAKFRSFILNYDWLVYTILGILLATCLIYYIYDQKRISVSRRRRQEIVDASQRVSQQRRPGASYRDHEIFQNVVQTAREYANREHRHTQLKPILNEVKQ
ncbi:uncharacterized protein LOC133326466 [Musca vetustissima]|uniref:uncharacterized protein LOC133326466 n=1 Tax=Musca vetustissima TaxID=27455 RepID=UPI002AB72980|nr:uncharacterized protein LOC133326466 [Musca vetustissima]